MANQKILIVDDDEDIRNGCKMILDRRGYDITLVESGEQAIEMLEKNQFDLVLTDLQMYDIDGVELLEYVKQKQPGCSMIMMTGYGSTDSALKTLEIGAYDYLTKPLNLTVLVSLVERCFEERGRPRQQAEKLQGSAERAVKKINIIRRLLGTLRLSEETLEVDINKTILRISKMLEEHFHLSDIKLEMHLFHGLPKILADPLAIEQVLMHIVTNSIDAFQDSGKKDKTIVIRSFVNNEDNIVISVKDNGCGIPAGNRQLLFQPGFTTKSAKKGERGFGLSYSRKRIEQAGGNITYETKEDEGSIFTVTLPQRNERRPLITEKATDAKTSGATEETAPEPEALPPEPPLKQPASPVVQTLPKAKEGNRKVLVVVSALLLAGGLFIISRYVKGPSKEMNNVKIQDKRLAAGSTDNAGQSAPGVAREGKSKPVVPEYEKLLELANTYKKKGMYDPAILACKQALAVKQDYSPAQYVVASVYALKKDAKNSVKWLSWAISGETKYINMVQKDDDFSAVINSPEFKKLLNNGQ